MNWMDYLIHIIEDYKGGDDSPLDSDEVHAICVHIERKINFHEGNITEEEYLKD